MANDLYPSSDAFRSSLTDSKHTSGRPRAKQGRRKLPAGAPVVDRDRADDLWRARQPGGLLARQAVPHLAPGRHLGARQCARRLHHPGRAAVGVQHDRLRPVSRPSSPGSVFSAPARIAFATAILRVAFSRRCLR